MFVKSSLKLALVLFWAVPVVFSQPAPQNTDALKAEALAFFQQKKYDEALQVAQRIVQIRERDEPGTLKLARALSDMATIQISAGKLKEAETNIRRSIAIYQSKTNLTDNEQLELASVFEVAGLGKMKDGKMSEATRDLRNALEIKEKYIGTQTLETAKTLWHLGNATFVTGDYQNSYDYYERVIKIRTGGAERLAAADDMRDVIQRYECAAVRSGNLEQARNLIESTNDKIEKKYSQALIDGGVVNGKALKLVKPLYPPGAAAVRQRGAVEVRVTIDENGRVVFACAISGFQVFYRNAERAAIDSKFTPTQINGKPVKVTGVIVYNFAP